MARSGGDEGSEERPGERRSARWLSGLALCVSGALGCGGSSGAGPGAQAVDGSAQAEQAAPEAGSPGATPDANGAKGDAANGAAPGAPEEKSAGAAAAAGPEMGRAEAQRYVLTLVNRDRAAHKLPAVVWDETAARGGKRHAEDMAQRGFTGHWGSDGSVPEERYTAAGGDGMVMENAGCFADGQPREIEAEPRFTAESLERVHKAFMNEKPPADGHRKNILTASHTSLGVGLAKAKGLDIACMAQEFVDDYGTYEALPKKASVGDTIKVAGEIKAPATLAGVGLARSELGKPIKVEKLLKPSAYPIPTPYVNFFTKGFKTPIPVEVSNNRFNVVVPLDDRGRPGLYGVSVWATFPGSKELKMISLRTIAVEGGRKGAAK